jgi:hypothetical protein
VPSQHSQMQMLLACTAVGGSGLRHSASSTKRSRVGKLAWKGEVAVMLQSNTKYNEGTAAGVQREGNRCVSQTRER